MARRKVNITPDRQITLHFDSTIQERFERFHAQHPEVYGALVAFCFDLVRRGRHHYGIKSVWERMRWHFQVDKDMGEDFKLCNDYHSRYVRLIIKDHPELEPMFELRKLRSP